MGSSLFLEIPMTEICPECRKPLPENAPAGICPGCLLRAGFESSDSEAAEQATILSQVEDLDTDADDPPVQPTILPGTSPVLETTKVGDRIRYFGDYELVEEIARGGMGVVYKANQTKLNRVVALKMILSGQLASEQDVRRFYSEAEAAANLDHPGIVPIYEVGEYNDQHYFSMAFVEGTSLAAAISKGPLPPQAATQITKSVAEAMAYAHEQGVIHRDLKPANVLLARLEETTASQRAHAVSLEVEGIEPGWYEPKVTDFGLAKTMEGDSQLTGTGQILGTPNYMPPEQAGGDTEQIGPAADVYSLGAVLYCLLTGHPPFQAASVMDTLRQVLEQDPVSPKEQNPEVPKDLETIALKCLEKDQQKRYESAQVLADECGRFLTGQPILARPVSQPERLWRWCQRHPVVAGLLLAIVLVMAIGTTISTFWAIRSNQNEQRAITLAGQREEARQQAENEKDRARALAEQLAQTVTAEKNAKKEALWHLYVAKLFPMNEAWRKRDFGRLEALLQESIPKNGEPDFRGWEWHYFQDQVNQASHELHTSDVTCGEVAWSKATGKIAVGNQNGTIDIFDQRGEKIEQTLPAVEGDIRDINWDSQGTRLAVAHGTQMSLWDIPTGKILWEANVDSKGAAAVNWSGDDTRIAATGMDGVVRVFDVTTRELRESLNFSSTTHKMFAYDLDWHPDGVRLAVGLRHTLTGIWSTETKQPILLKPRKRYNKVTNSVCWSPSGNRLACASDPALTIYNSALTEVLSLPSAGRIYDCTWTADGERIIAGNGDHSLRIWDSNTGEEIRTLRIHSGPIKSLALSPDEQWLLSASRTKVCLNPMKELSATERWPLFESKDNLAIDWSRDGKMLAAVTFKNSVEDYCGIWDVEGQRTQKIPVGRGGDISFSPDGAFLLKKSYYGNAVVWDVAKQKVVRVISPLENADLGGLCARWSPSGKRLALMFNRQPYVTDIENVSRLESLATKPNCWAIAWSPDSHHLAIGYQDNHLEVWDAVSRTLAYRIPTEGFIQYALAWSPDGEKIVAGSASGVLSCFRARDGALIRQRHAHQGVITALAFHPNGRRFASVNLSGVVKIWDTATGHGLVTLPLGVDASDIMWHPNGNRLTVGCKDGTVYHFGSVGKSLPKEKTKQFEMPRNEKSTTQTSPQKSNLDIALNVPIPADSKTLAQIPTMAELRVN